jgi:ferrous iron transport protein A
LQNHLREGVVTLAEAPFKTVLAIKSLAPEGSDLLHLGFVPGAQVRLVRTAPLGDPVEVEIAGARLAIRKEALSAVEVVEVSK